MSERHSPNEAVCMVYTNYRGETSVRNVIPIKIWYGKTDWHQQEQWLLDGFDIDKNSERTFAMIDIRSWFTKEA